MKRLTVKLFSFATALSFLLTISCSPQENGSGSGSGNNNSEENNTGGDYAAIDPNPDSSTTGQEHMNNRDSLPD